MGSEIDAILSKLLDPPLVRLRAFGRQKELRNRKEGTPCIKMGSGGGSPTSTASEFYFLGEKTDLFSKVSS